MFVHHYFYVRKFITHIDIELIDFGSITSYGKPLTGLDDLEKAHHFPNRGWGNVQLIQQRLFSESSP